MKTGHGHISPKTEQSLLCWISPEEEGDLLSSASSLEGGACSSVESGREFWDVELST